MTSALVDVKCAVPYCGQLIARAKPDSTLEAKCHRCYAITLWNKGVTTITRRPKRIKDISSGKWRAIEDFDAIDRIMREAVAVEGINVRSPRGR